jgi:hypothetical protein
MIKVLKERSYSEDDKPKITNNSIKVTKIL